MGIDVQRAAREMFVYGLPIVDLYRILHNFALDPTSTEFKAPLNELHHSRTVADPADRSIVAMNVDTPYSYAWLDLRGGPVLFTMPDVPGDRYMSAQLVDLYTYIVGYVSPRTTGSAGGRYLVVGPDWEGDNPQGHPVFACPTQLCLVLIRTELFDESDLDNVVALQNRVHLQAHGEVEPLEPLVAPVDVRAAPSLDYLAVLGWMLSLMPVLDDERMIRDRITGVMEARGDQGVSILAGLGEGLQDVIDRARNVRSSGEIFGSREFLGHDYLSRAAGAFLGILGNAQEEYLGVGYQADAHGEPFTGSSRYTIRFRPDALPPVGAFWSITVYDADHFLYANAINRYVIGSRDLESMTTDVDGGVTIHVQHERPSDVTNWLPCPAGPFSLAFRTYLPGVRIRNGEWTAPPVVPEETQ